MPAEKTHRSEPAFLARGGEMAGRIQDFDWSSTPLGAPQTWSPALRTTIQVLLANPLPLLLWWGPEYISIYNDAYRPLFGRKHPGGLGRPAQESCSEIWHVLKPLIDTPFRGGPATWTEDMELEINRSGFTEETHFTVAYSPVPDETAEAGIGGVLATVHEITDKVVGERRLTILRDLGTRAAGTKAAEEACRVAAAILGQHAKDIPFALLYLTDPDGRTARLAASCGVAPCGIQEDSSFCPPLIRLAEALGDNSAWSLEKVRRTGEMQVESLAVKFGSMGVGVPPDPPKQAAILPIRSHIANQFWGFLVAGVSSRLRFDAGYRDFLELVTAQIATAIGNARAYEEERRRSQALAELDRAKTVFFSNVSHEVRAPLTAIRVDSFTGEAMAWLAEPKEARVSERPAPRESHARLLFADDNADMRAHVAHILDPRYQVVTAPDGRSAIEEARREPPDLILADIMMPGLDGFGLLEQVRADPALCEIPVVLISARAGEEARTEGIAAGADGYLTKPFHAPELLARVETTLHLQRLRREARAAVERQNTQFETLLNQAPIGVYLIDADFRIRQVNPTARAVFGDIPNLIGRDFGELIHTLWKKSYADEVVEHFRRTLRTGEPYVMPERVEERLDRGAREYFEWRIDRIPLPDGSSGVVCYFRDISAQVLAREEIARSEQRFRAFVTASSDVIYRMSADWSEMRHLHGRDFIADTSDTTRAWLDKYIHPDDQQVVVGTIAKAIRDKAPFEMEHRVIRVDGSLGWTFSRAVPLLDRDGNIEEWFGSARDVTERKLAEERLGRLTTQAEQERRLYQTILSSTPDLVYVFDLDHRFIYANSALLKMWGKTSAEALGKTCLELGYEPWHAAMHDREIEQVKATGQPVRGEVPFTGTQGRRIYDYIFVPVFGPFGDVVAVAGTTRDITERQQSEDELRRANQDLEQFAYSASHDLQEPLRSVKIYSELLSRRYSDHLDAEGLKFVRFMRNGATRMETLVRDLLAYTQVGRLDGQCESADANLAFETAIANLAPAISETDARISSGPLPTLPVHATHLQQLFQNLIGNAIKYRHPARRPAVRVSAERQDGMWMFTVADNGIGIDPEYKETIFGLFKRLHTSDEYSGTGIGLAICQRIVDRYHGRIWVESESGQGSAFHLTLPV